MEMFSLVGFRAVLGKELREAWRTGRLPITLIVFFILGALSPLAAYYTPELLKNATGTSGVQIIGLTPTLKDPIASTIAIRNPFPPTFLMYWTMASFSVGVRPMICTPLVPVAFFRSSGV